MTRRIVRDTDGRQYHLLKRSQDTSLVRPVDGGDRRYLPTAELTVVDDTSRTSAVLDPLPSSVRTLVTTVHDERTLAVLQDLALSGPLAVETLMSSYEFCERTFHGVIAELQVAELVTETTVAGERAYDTTEQANRALASLRSSSDPEASTAEE